MKTSTLLSSFLALAATTLAVAIPEANNQAVTGNAIALNEDGSVLSSAEVNVHQRSSRDLETRQTSGVCSNFITTVLGNHNVHRANHSAPNLVWNQTVANHAYEWAVKCQWAHNTSYGEGQNLAAGYQYVRDAISDGWYNGEMTSFAGQYGQQTPDMSKFGSFGHFTQVVWKGTTSVGCASVQCSNIANIPNAYYTVCNYYPPGNYLGSFDKNVGQPMNQATARGKCYT